jgi:citrate lyase subunit beta / citryl-CoA lyase
MIDVARRLRPRRSVLYMPGANARAMEKSREIDCDAVIFDLEDAVAPDAKAQARSQVAAAVGAGGFGHREIVVRINGIDTPWAQDDAAAIANLPIDALLLPKIETIEQLQAYENLMSGARATTLPLWVMIETPRGVLGVEQLLASSQRVEVVVLGTSDLVKDLRARHTPDRRSVLAALSHCVLAARAFDRVVLDGVHLDFKDVESFERVCQQGRDLGFDGKTLIPPTQVDVANAVFGPSTADVEQAKLIVAAWAEAQRAGKGVAVVNGRLVENLHAAEAERVLAFAEALASR